MKAVPRKPFDEPLGEAVGALVVAPTEGEAVGTAVVGKPANGEFDGAEVGTPVLDTAVGVAVGIAEGKVVIPVGKEGLAVGTKDVGVSGFKVGFRVPADGEGEDVAGASVVAGAPVADGTGDIVTVAGGTVTGAADRVVAGAGVVAATGEGVVPPTGVGVASMAGAGVQPTPAGQSTNPLKPQKRQKKSPSALHPMPPTRQVWSSKHVKYRSVRQVAKQTSRLGELDGAGVGTGAGVGPKEQSSKESKPQNRQSWSLKALHPSPPPSQSGSLTQRWVEDWRQEELQSSTSLLAVLASGTHLPASFSSFSNQ